MMSTLPTLPGYTFHVRGVVTAAGSTHALKGPAVSQQLAELMSSLGTQAGRLGGNAIVDVTVTRISESTFVITGTAVVTLEPLP